MHPVDMICLLQSTVHCMIVQYNEGTEVHNPRCYIQLAE